jgi:hypothetical protein
VSTLLTSLLASERWCADAYIPNLLVPDGTFGVEAGYVVHYRDTFPVRAVDSSIIQSVRTGYKAHSVSCSLGKGALSPGGGGGG